jgi:hypothetical protein
MNSTATTIRATERPGRLTRSPSQWMAFGALYARGVIERHRAKLRERLRRPPSRYSVPGTLPVLFFGDLRSARIATVGLNPSDREYTDGNGVPLTGSLRRFQTLDSLGASDRSVLDDAQCDEAVEWMRRYFDPAKPVFNAYFGHLKHLLGGLGADFVDGTAAQLDLVQEATHPTWTALRKADPAEHERLLAADLPFLEWAASRCRLSSATARRSRIKYGYG